MPLAFSVDDERLLEEWYWRLSLLLLVVFGFACHIAALWRLFHSCRLGAVAVNSCLAGAAAAHSYLAGAVHFCLVDGVALVFGLESESSSRASLSSSKSANANASPSSSKSGGLGRFVLLIVVRAVVI